MAIVSSSADSLTGSLNADGFTTTIAPFAPVSGSAPPAYDQTKTVAFFDHLYELTPSESNDLSLGVQATQMFNAASSARLGVDEIGANGTADFSSAHFLLTDSVGTGPTVLGLSVAATVVHSDSNSFFVFPDRGFLAGDASFHSITITGALLGGRTLTFSGDAKPDTVLYSSPTVTITLDEQGLLLPPTTTGGVIGPMISTDAIDIQFHGAKFLGNTISGHFDFGRSLANFALIHPFV
jgi:hypothetical protein